ncbi:MAG: YihY/virulence factor BrkB family protein [Chloroherpetonaceae bacterium]|nr:YihY/virulence factor BrkB family protein [Chloroherpetonaceae bacterium]
MIFEEKHLRRLVLQKYVQTIWSYLTTLFQKFDQDNALLLASAIAFDIFLCGFPFILILLSLTTVFLESSHTSVSALSIYLSKFMPNGKEILDSLLSRLINDRPNINLFGVLGLLWTSMSLSSTLRTVLSIVFEFKETRSFFRTRAIDFLVVFAQFLFLILSILITGAISISMYWIEMNGDVIPFLSSAFGRGISVTVAMLFSILMFFSAYRFLPNGKVDIRAAFAGAFISGALWELAKYGFDWLVTRFTSTEKIYGSYSVIVALALWVYYSGILFILGGEIAKIFASRNHRVLVNEPRNIG